MQVMGEETAKNPKEPEGSGLRDQPERIPHREEEVRQELRVPPPQPRRVRARQGRWLREESQAREQRQRIQPRVCPSLRGQPDRPMR